MKDISVIVNMAHGVLFRDWVGRRQLAGVWIEEKRVQWNKEEIETAGTAEARAGSAATA